MGKPLSSEHVFQIGFALGIAGMILYLLWHGYKRKRPDLTKSINVIISIVGIFYGVELIRVIFFAKPEDLGIPVHYKAPMLIGAIVMIWRSVEGVSKLFSPILTARKDEPPPKIRRNKSQRGVIEDGEDRREVSRQNLQLACIKVQIVKAAERLVNKIAAP